jgi:hypothetical protein
MSPATLGSSTPDRSVMEREMKEPPAEEQASAEELAYMKSHEMPGVDLGGRQIVYDTTREPLGGLAANQGLNFQGLVQNEWVPYDCAVAVGLNHIILMNNAQWMVLDKTNGAQLFYTMFDAWFGNAANGGFDPKCVYDAAAGRWMLLCIEQASPKALIDISVSKTSNPLGEWWQYHLDATVDGQIQTSNWLDFPGLGYDDSCVYVTGNMFSFAHVFQYAKIRVLSKTQLYNGQPATWTDFVQLSNGDGSLAYAPKPAQCMSSSRSGYIFNTLANGGSTCTLWRVDNGPTAPVLTRMAPVAVGAYAVPPNAAQLGTTSTIWTSDCRTQECVFQNGVLYTAFSEKKTYTPSCSAVRFLKIDTGTAQPIADMTYTASGIHYYYPAVTLDGYGNVFLTMSRSASTEYVSVWQTVMKTTETEFEPSALVKSSGFSWFVGRWGDYNAIARDPTNGANVWLYGGCITTLGLWATWTGQLFLPVPTTVEPPAVQPVNVLPARTDHPAIRFSLREARAATVSVFSATGRLVREIAVPGAVAGDNLVVWDGRTSAGAAAPTGVYIARVATRGESAVARAFLLR